MSFRQDYILRQIEKMVQMIAALISNRKTQQFAQQTDVDAALSELTGFNKETFVDRPTPEQLALVFSLLHDDNMKAMASVLLMHKDKDYYRPFCEGLLSKIDRTKLHKSVIELLSQ